MPIRLLIVEGNSTELSASLVACGGSPYNVFYGTLMQQLGDDVECTSVFPAEAGVDCLPEGKSFDDYDGAVWTGSALDAFAGVPVVLNQKAFAKNLFASGTPIFGSCWGLQIVTEALGGKVARNPLGREIGVAKNIELNEVGTCHLMYQGKPREFETFAVHLDHVIEPAPGSRVLAHNAMSPIQALVIEQDGKSFWGVQYHPEFDGFVMGVIYERLAHALPDEGLAASRQDVMDIAKTWKGSDKVFDQIELKNWLTHVRKKKKA